jgi:tetratricopeptide (TPR) repeat protein
MARERKRKRLNTKLLTALGLVGMAIVVLGIYLATKYYLKDPWPYIEQARVYAEEAKRQSKPGPLPSPLEKDPEKAFELMRQEMQEDWDINWKRVVEEYIRAVDNSGRDESARIQACIELGELYNQHHRYLAARSAWELILKLDANHYKANRNLADFYYERVKYSPAQFSSQGWSKVREYGEDLIRLKPKDPYGYVLTSHALLALAEIGALADTEAARKEAEELIQEALNLEHQEESTQTASDTGSPNVLAYWLLSQLELARLSANASEQAKEKAEKQAESHLRKAIELNPEEPQAYINLYETIIYKRIYEQRQKISELSTATERKTARSELREKVQTTIQDLDSYIKTKFAQDGRFYLLKARILSLTVWDVSDFGPLIQCYEQALSCPNEEPSWYFNLAESHRIRGEDAFDESGREDLEESYEYLRRGFYHRVYVIPENEIPGPKGGLHDSIRTRIMQQLVDASAALSRMSSEPSEQQRYLKTAKEAYTYLRDKLGAEVAPCKIAAGEIAYAAGNQTEAIKQFYQADQMLKLEGRPNALLKRKLFHVLKESGHQAMSVIYAMQMWSLGRSYGRDLVEYAEAVATFPDSSVQEKLLSTIDLYDEQLGSSYRYRDRIQVVKAQVLVQLDRRDEARAILEAISASNERLEYLRAESQANITDRIAALSKIVEAHPENENAVRSLIGYYVQLGKEDKSYYQAARARIEKLLVAETNQDLYLTRMQLVLSEEDPSQIPPERRDEIVEQSIQAAMKGFDQKIALGQFYHRKAEQAVVHGESDPANQLWRKAEEYFKSAAQMRPGSLESIQGQFDIALQTHNQSQAKQIIEQLRQQESPETLLYEGLLHMSQKRWEEAARQLKEYLDERPISLIGHVAIARAYQALGRLDDAMEEARLAWTHDVNNINTQRLLMALYHRRNQQTARKVGWENLDSRQISEIISMINRIITANPDDPDAVSLQVIYYPLWIRYQLNQLKISSQITPEEKIQGLAKISEQQKIVENVCRKLTEKNPQDARSWLQWSQVNYQYYQAVWEPAEKQKALQRTEQIYKEALTANPTATGLAGYYASFLRANGRTEEAEKILLGMIEKTTGADQHEARIQLGQMYSLYPFMHAQAQAQFEQVLQEDEYNRSATLLLADLFTKQEKINEAQQLYQKLRKHKNDPLVMSKEIFLLLNSGRLEEAEALVVQMEQEFPQQSEEYLTRGNLEMYKSNYSEAEKYADQILGKIQEETVQVNALLLKSKAQYYSGRFNEAEDSLIHLRSLLPDSSNIGRLLLADVYWAKNERRRAVQELETAWNLEPDSREIQTVLLNRLKQLKDWLRLEQKYLELMQRYTQSPDLYFEAASVMKQQAAEQFRAQENLNAQASYNKALSWMQTALNLSTRTGRQIRPISLAMMNLSVEVGNFYRAINNAATAREYYQSALNLANKLIGQHPDDPGILLAQAEAYYGLGRREEALQYFEKSLQQVEDDPSQSILVLERATRVGALDDIITWSKRKLAERPDWLILRVLLAKMYLQQGQVGNQIQELETARTMTKNKQLLALIDQTLAASYIQESRADKAIEAYQRLLEVYPDNVGALNNLAYLLMNEPGRETEAVEMAERAYKLTPGNADVMDTYAGALIQQDTDDSYRKAELILRRAMQLKQREGNEIPAGLYVHLGQALLGLGRHSEAGAQLDAAEEILRTGTFLEDVEALKAKIRETRAKLNPVR